MNYRQQNYETSAANFPPPPDHILSDELSEEEDPYEIFGRKQEFEVPIQGLADFKYEIGSKGRGPGQFGGWVQHFCISEDGYALYACDPFNKRIQIISLPDRKCKHSFSMTMPQYDYSARGIAVLRDGKLCVNCVGYDGTSRIGIFTPDGQLSHTFGPGLIGQSLAMTVDQMDRIIVVDRRRMKITTVSKNGEGINAFHNPVADDSLRISSNSRGDIILPDHLSNFVWFLDERGVPKGKLHPPGGSNSAFCYPAGVAVDAMDNIFVCDVGNHSIAKFDPEGHFAGRILSKSDSLWRPHDISISGRGHLLTSEVSATFVKLFGYRR